MTAPSVGKQGVDQSSVPASLLAGATTNISGTINRAARSSALGSTCPQTIGPSGAGHVGTDRAALEEILYGESVELSTLWQMVSWQAVTLALVN
jgi:hypothetical protein